MKLAKIILWNLLATIFVGVFGQTNAKKEWNKIKFSYQINDFKNFLLKYPNSQWAPAAQRKLDSLNETYTFYDAIKNSDTSILQLVSKKLTNDSLKKELCTYNEKLKLWISSSFYKNPSLLKQAFKTPVESLLSAYQDTAEFLIIHLMLAKINEIRKHRHLNLLRMNYQLAYEAHHHAEAMCQRNFFSHVDPIRGNPFIRAKRAHFEGSIVGENIAAGQESIEHLFAAWMKSSGHRKNILYKNYNTAGMGFCVCHNSKSKYKYYYVNMFGYEK
jgi:hypothetical protein